MSKPVLDYTSLPEQPQKTRLRDWLIYMAVVVVLTVVVVIYDHFWGGLNFGR